jgi:hypothetical protein
MLRTKLLIHLTAIAIGSGDIGTARQAKATLSSADGLGGPSTEKAQPA